MTCSGVEESLRPCFLLLRPHDDQVERITTISNLHFTSSPSPPAYLSPYDRIFAVFAANLSCFW